MRPHFCHTIGFSSLSYPLWSFCSLKTHGSLTCSSELQGPCVWNFLSSSTPSHWQCQSWTWGVSEQANSEKNNSLCFVPENFQAHMAKLWDLLLAYWAGMGDIGRGWNAGVGPQHARNEVFQHHISPFSLVLKSSHPPMPLGDQPWTDTSTFSENLYTPRRNSTVRQTYKRVFPNSWHQQKSMKVSMLHEGQDHHGNWETALGTAP